jgi:hypothetical protein
MTSGQVPSFNPGMERSPRKTEVRTAGATPGPGVVLRLPSPAERRTPTEAPSQPGRVLRQFLERQDASQNEEWDRLAALVEHAWVWRDPESVAEVEACLDGLKRRLLTRR